MVSVCQGRTGGAEVTMAVVSERISLRRQEGKRVSIREEAKRKLIRIKVMHTSNAFFFSSRVKFKSDQNMTDIPQYFYGSYPCMYSNKNMLNM